MRQSPLQYDKVLFLLERSEFTRSLARRRVTVFDYPDGRLEIRYCGRALRYVTFDKLPHGLRPTPVTDRKELDEVLGRMKADQARRDAEGSAFAAQSREPGVTAGHDEAAQVAAAPHASIGGAAGPSPPSSDFAGERLAAALDFVHARQMAQPVKRSASSPVRRGQANHMFGTK